MKILHIGENIYGGGAENVFCQTLSALKRYGSYELKQYAAFKSHPEADVKPDLDFNRENRSAIPSLSSIYSIYNYKVLKKYLQALQPDVIHLQLIGNLSPAVLRAVYRYKRKHRETKIVQTAHTFEHVCSHYGAFDYRKRTRCLDCMRDRYKVRIFYRLCSRKGGFHSLAKGLASLISDVFYNRKLIDIYIAPSPFLASLLKIRYGDKSDIRVVRNVISVQYAQSVERTETVTYFGRLSEEKNLELLIQAFSLVRIDNKQAKLRIIGDGPEREVLLKLANEEGLGTEIEFIPFVSHVELSGLIEDAKVFVLTSKLYETFSLVVYEAVMAGLVPVVPSHGAMKEGVDWLGCGVLYRSEDPQHLAEKIIAALENYKSFLPLLENARTKITRELNEQRYVASLSEIYLDASGSNL